MKDLEQRMDDLEDNYIVQALSYLAKQNNKKPITREDLYNALLRFKSLK